MDTDKTFRTRFNGRSITVETVSVGQTVALGTMPKDENGDLASGGVMTILLVVEGCVGPDEWALIRDGLARKTVSIEDVMSLFGKILEKSAKSVPGTATSVEIPGTFKAVSAE